MSKTIDEKVVSLKFDNKNFEKNVSTTMSTLDKLKEKLKFSNASKGLENLNTAANKVNMSGLSSAVETIQARFSALDVVAVTALANITTAAMNAGTRMVKALTLDPITTGFREYETQMGAIQTILANTQSKGSTLEDVTEALDELNTYADQTIYNFTEMTRNIGTFTAAGVDLDKSVTSIKGIANLAAVSGSTSAQASTAMYQLSQALAAGRVSLMDWNSVVNAGMGGELFQNALKRTATQMGYNVDALIEKYGSFRESLTQGGWLTAEVLTETLTQLSGAYTEADLIAQGYTEKQAKEIVELANTAVGAATEVKTFTQLFDTMKEAVGSGWAKTWQIIIGDFEEAKELLTEVSNVFGSLINSSSDARNSMLQGWKDLGGRTELIQALKNVFEGLAGVVKPIGEAFREIFPRTTSEQLYNITVAVRKFTDYLKVSDSTAQKIKSTFKGLFSIIDIFLNVLWSIAKGAATLIGSLAGIEGGILGVTAAIGDWITNLRNSIVEADTFGTIIQNVTGFLVNCINAIKEFSLSLLEGFSPSAGYTGLLGFFKSLLDIVTQVGSAIITAFNSIGSGASSGGLFEVLNGGLFAWLLLSLKNFIQGITSPLEEVGGFLENLTGILDGVRGCFEAYQNNLKADTLMKIASAIGILAVSLLLIASIDGQSLTYALAGISILFLELFGALSLFTKLSSTFKGVATTVPLMISLSVSMLLLAAALKVLSTTDFAGIAKGLIGIGGLMLELSIFLKKFSASGGLIRGSVGILLLSSAMVVLSAAVKNFASISWEGIAKGLASVGALLLEVALFTKLTGNASGVISTSVGMLILASSMKVFASVMNTFGSMSWESIGKGLAAMAGALLEMAIGLRLIPKSAILIGPGLLIVAAAMDSLAGVFSKFGAMDWEGIAKGLAAIGLSLIELAVGLRLMSGTLAGSASLVVAATGLSILTSVMKDLSSMSWGDIGKGLVSIAGGMILLGVAGALLNSSGATLGLLGLAAAMIGISAAVAIFSVALGAISVGISALAASLSAGAVTIVAGLSAIIVGILELVPTIVQIIGRTVLGIAQVIGEHAPILAEAILNLITSIAGSLAKHVPKFVEALAELIIGIINGLAKHMPDFINAIMNLIGSILKGAIDALKGVDIQTLIQGIVAVGLMTGLMYALGSIVPLIPSAMLGLLGVGAAIAELSLVLAAVGGLAQIPGLKWLIEEGGNFLQLIGNSIGKFVGGLIGGIGEGASNSLPAIATNLSQFMTNLKPFINGAKKLDPSMLSGVGALVNVMIQLTGASFLEGITSWITGGNSLTSFAEQLVPFGKAMNNYAKEIRGVDQEAIIASANAAQSLSELASGLPNSGGMVSWFTGDNNLSDFAEQLVPFGKAMKEYGKSISGIDSEAVIASSNAAESLATLASNLPKSGGIFSWFTGQNDLTSFSEHLIPFGKNIKEYSKEIEGIDNEAVTASATAASSLSELASKLPNSGGMVSWFTGENDLVSFSEQLVPFGKAMKEYSKAIEGIDTKTVTASATAASSLSELAANLPNSGGIVGWFTGENDLISFAEQLVPFGKAMNNYAKEIRGIDYDAVTSSATAAEALSKLAANLPNSGGVVSWFTGNNDIDVFGEKLVDFGKGMKLYAKEIKGIDSDAVTASAAAAESLATLARNLPETGGISSWFTGDEDLSAFGEQLIPFGKAMKSYSKEVTGIDAEAVIASATAAKAFSEVAKNLPESSSGGVNSIVGWFTGNGGLSFFGYQLIEFGKSMKAYSDTIVGIDAAAITASATAAQAFAELAKNLPTTGGLLNSIFGESMSMETFGEQLVPFGKYMKEYSNAVTGIDAEAVTASATAAKSLSELMNNLPKTGGIAGTIVSLFSGQTIGMETFGNELVPFGKYMKEYSDAVTGIDSNAVTSSATAGKTLSELVNNLPVNNGIFSNIFGEKMSMESFGKQIVSFGSYMKSYFESIKSVDSTAITASATAAQSLAQLVNNLPDSGGITSLVSGNSLYLFGVQLAPFGTNLKTYSDSIKGLDIDSIKSATSTIGSLVEMVNKISDIDISGIVPFRLAMNMLSGINFNDVLDGFDASSERLVAIGSEFITSISDGMTSNRSKMSSTILEIIDGMLSSIKGKESSYVSSGKTIVDKIVSGIKDKKTVLIDTIKNMLQEAVNAIKGYNDDFKTAGANVVSGFANGISSNTYLATAKAKAMAEAAASAARKALNEHSPSRVFYQIGDYAGIGFVNALVNIAKAAYQASSEVGVSAREGLTNAVSKVASMVNSDMDFQPTIRPVLDLSDVESGAGAISGLFGMTPTVGLSSARTINSMVNSRLQNGTSTSDVVSAIKDLKKMVGNTPSNSYTINGITYDDGSAVSEAIQTLVRATRIERRK